MTGEQIKKSRWRLKKTQGELAEAAGISTTTWYKAEKDFYVSEKTIFKIEETLKELLKC
jgi:DNA-binding XRE family transcriptional regulator